MDSQAVLDRVSALTAQVQASRPYVLVGIGGRGASGKTTLARSIPAAQIVGTEEFWDGTGFEISRLRAEVLEPILHGRSTEYRAFAWGCQQPLTEPRIIVPEGVIVVEGVCALHVLVRESYDLRVWVDTPREIRLARAIAREGEGARQIWEERWMPGEDQYVERDDPISAAAMIIDGS